MPQIVQSPAILQAARSAIEILLRFKGVQVALIPQKGTVVEKPSGGEDFVAGVPRAPQTVSLSKVGNDIVSDGANDEQAYVLRNYALTGRFDMAVMVGDTWTDGEADYSIVALDQTSGFKTAAEVVGYVKL